MLAGVIFTLPVLYVLSALPFTPVILFTCAQLAIPSNFVLSVALINHAVLCVASKYVVSVALITSLLI
jgi:hypothetical protein